MQTDITVLDVHEAALGFKKYAPKAMLDSKNTNGLFQPKIEPEEAFKQNFVRLELMKQELLQIGQDTFELSAKQLKEIEDHAAQAVQEYFAAIRGHQHLRVV